MWDILLGIPSMAFIWIIALWYFTNTRVEIFHWDFWVWHVCMNTNAMTFKFKRRETFHEYQYCNFWLGLLSMAFDSEYLCNDFTTGVWYLMTTSVTAIYNEFWVWRVYVWLLMSWLFVLCACRIPTSCSTFPRTRHISTETRNG